MSEYKPTKPKSKFNNQYQRADIILKKLTPAEVITYFDIDVYDIAIAQLQNMEEDVVKAMLDEIENPEQNYIIRKKILHTYETTPIKASSEIQAIQYAKRTFDWKEEIDAKTTFTAEKI